MVGRTVVEGAVGEPGDNLKGCGEWAEGRERHASVKAERGVENLRILKNM